MPQLILVGKFHTILNLNAWGRQYFYWTGYIFLDISYAQTYDIFFLCCRKTTYVKGIHRACSLWFLIEWLNVVHGGYCVLFYAHIFSGLILFPPVARNVFIWHLFVKVFSRHCSRLRKLPSLGSCLFLGAGRIQSIPSRRTVERNLKTAG